MKIGEFLDLEIRIHPAFLLLIALAAAAGYMWDVLLLICLLLSHELAHIVVARALSVDVYALTLMPYGSVAEVEGLGPGQGPREIAVALAGPLHNFMLLSLGWLVWISGVAQPRLLSVYLQVNFVLACFNLLPVLPLDGGRVLRALWEESLGLKQATNRLVGWGRVAAVGLIIAGFAAIPYGYFPIGVIILGGFLWFGSSDMKVESAMAQWPSLWRKRRRFQNRKRMPVKTLALPESLTVREAVDRLAPSTYAVVYVLDRDLSEVGVLTEGQLLDEALAGGLHRTLRELVGGLS